MYEKIIAGIDSEIDRLTRIRTLLRGEPKFSKAILAPLQPKKRRMTAEGRERIRQAQLKRWRKINRDKKVAMKAAA